MTPDARRPLLYKLSKTEPPMGVGVRATSLLVHLRQRNLADLRALRHGLGLDFTPIEQDMRSERQSKRIKTFQSATLVLDGASRRIHLLNVSLTGLLAHAQDPVAEGARVRVECLDVVRDAIVQWSEGKKFGLRFDRALSAEQVAVLAAPVRRSA